MDTDTPKKLTLTVENTADLDGGVKPSVAFGPEGGTVGTASGSNWILKDRLKTIAPKHLKVFYADGAFCIEALSDAGVLVNDAARPVPPGDPFQVSDGDTLRIGRFTVRAFISELEQGSGLNDRWDNRFTSVETMVDGRVSDIDSAGNVLDTALAKANRAVSLQERLENQRKLDPIELMQENGSVAFATKDPLAALELNENLEARRVTNDLSDYLGATPEDSSKPAIPDNLQPTSAYFLPPRIQDRNRRDKMTAALQTASREDPYIAALAAGGGERPVEATNAIEAQLRDSWLGNVETAPGAQIDHVVLRPLCHGLGLPVQEMSVPEADRLAHDIGEALRTAISGLMDIHKAEMSSRSLLAETHIHAIEDNPLRLADNPDEAVHDLFMVQSPVHLSASAAIGESLHTVRHHQEASEAATDAALETVLKALAPIALARRFLKYKGHAPRTGDLDAWHWRMYQHYYSELSSDRQGGLSRMFREVFRQVYDREMRARSLES